LLLGRYLRLTRRRREEKTETVLPGRPGGPVFFVSCAPILRVNGAGSRDQPVHDRASGQERGLSRSPRIRNSGTAGRARDVVGGRGTLAAKCRGHQSRSGASSCQPLSDLEPTYKTTFTILFVSFVSFCSKLQSTPCTRYSPKRTDPPLSSLSPPSNGTVSWGRDCWGSRHRMTEASDLSVGLTAEGATPGEAVHQRARRATFLDRPF
jgi:hypothetical protein